MRGVEEGAWGREIKKVGGEMDVQLRTCGYKAGPDRSEAAFHSVTLGLRGT